MTTFKLSDAAKGYRKKMQSILKEEPSSGNSPCIGCTKWIQCEKLGVFKYVNCYKVKTGGDNGIN